MSAELEKLAYEAAQRALDKQEGLLEEVRGRTGVLLAASSLAASFLGQQAFRDPHPHALALIAVTAFVVSIGASVFILLLKKNLIFSMRGVGLYEGLYGIRHDSAELYRRLTYELTRFWDENDRKIQPLFQAFRLAAFAMVLEVITLAALLGAIIV